MPDLHTSAAYADEETVDTDFVHHLVRGSELLQSGEATQARSMLERALRLQPKNQRGQTLLALSYFKLGLFDRAEEIYRALLDDHPQDPTLRVNLGLVQLKTGRSEEAAASFASALELAPGHVKAMNYLGLAFLQVRDFAGAREWFDRAGNVPMRDRAAAALAASPLRQVGEAALSVLEAREVPFSPPEPTLPPSADAAVTAWVATAPGAPPDPQVPGLEHASPDLASFSAAHRLEFQPAAPFAHSADGVVVEVRGEMLSRLDGLVASFGNLSFQPEFKRFRGRVTEKTFGEPARRMMRVAGHGRLWVATLGRRFHAVEIGDEAAYFREEVLFAFEESLLFENGRVPSKYGSDLHLVHLRNRGRALLASRCVPRSVDVSKDEPCRVPLEVLLGWHGNVAPRIVALVEAEAPDGLPLAAVELAGEGRVLLDAPL
jgi:uncharacterized protein (AIM24 family)